jgi:polysaccharide biosynthesis protein PslH
LISQAEFFRFSHRACSRPRGRRRARILFVACHLPFPPLSGGRRRELELIRRVCEHHELHLLVASKTPEQDRANTRHLERYCAQVEVFPALALPPEPERSTLPLQVLRHRCPRLTRRVEELLGERRFDLIHVEGFYLIQHIPFSVAVPVLLVEQNVEYELWRQRANGTGGGSLQHLRTLRSEVESWQRADLLCALTEEDRGLIQAALPSAEVRLVPDGADHLPSANGTRSAFGRRPEPLLVFLANFAYAPNLDAVDYLCDEILPAIHARLPAVHLWLVGNEPPVEVRRRADERVVVTGRVPAVVPYIDAADLMVLPLRIGGGMKVKAIESLRRGKPVVSSSIGAQGLPPAAREAIALADDGPEFARTVIELLREPRRRERLARRAAAAAGLLPSWDASAAALLDAYDELLACERASAMDALAQGAGGVPA